MQQTNILSVVVFLVSFECLRLVNSRSYNNGLIFYDLQTFQPFLPPTVSVSRGRGLATVKYSEKGSIWSTFGKPCECKRSVCGCCAGIKVKQYDFDQKICANVTFVPPKEEALLEVYLNDKPSSKYGISVRNPSPFCIPVMMGIPMAMCVQMSNIAIQGNNLNMCMDFIVRLATTDLFEMHFQCMKMGLDGFQYIDKDGNPVTPPGNSKTEIDDDYYDYDEADENEIGYATNEQEDKNIAAATAAAQQTANTIDNTYIVGLQQQMQQLQEAQQVKIKKNDLVTQINSDTTLAPIVVEAQNEIIAAITAAYGTASIDTATQAATEIDTEAMEATESETDAEIEAERETETETQSKIEPLTKTTINPVNNELGYNTHAANNYIETPTTAASTSIIASTTEAAISKPIAAPINVYTDTTTFKNIIGVTVADVPLENVTTNYASNTFNTTDSNIDIETTTVAEKDPTLAYISAPSVPTAVGVTETATLNSTAYETVSTESIPLENTSPATSTSSSTTSLTRNVNANDKIAIKTYKMPEAPHIARAIDTSYWYEILHGWSWH